MELTEKRLGDLSLPREEILADYRLAYKSRQASLIGRREVMSGKAKFGIFGGGKEVAQIALAKVFQKGDFRAGYYRDQTLLLALGILSLQEFFAQLYAHANVNADPASAGRQMNNHFASRSLNEDGSWKDLTEIFNTAADLSPTAGQMPKLVGLGFASRLYRELPALSHLSNFSKNGNEIAFGTIGNASCAEGLFWEAVNAIGVLQAPVVLSIWDDDYGISVPNKYQITGENIGKLLTGFQREPGANNGYDLYTARGWNYPELIHTYQQAAEATRLEQVPSIVHIIEMTQPQGHSTSGSHERYKTKERLAWEAEYDCVKQMRMWILNEGIISEAELEQLESEDQEFIEDARRTAWDAFQNPIKNEIEELCEILDEIPVSDVTRTQLDEIQKRLRASMIFYRGDVIKAAHKAILLLQKEGDQQSQLLIEWKNAKNESAKARYGAHLFQEGVNAAQNVPEIAPVFSQNSPKIQGYRILNTCFEAMLERDPRVFAFGEDVGNIGDVNQGFAGLQETFGKLRVSDTGIREVTIVGQAVGLALRGLRPIAEIQYLDYILYALQTLSDDLATLHWRTHGGQAAPVIIRTRGHRLEGIWHAGSPMAGIINLVRGIHVLVPRNMVQAAGFYNTLMQAEEPGLVVEVLNGYRTKEQLPDNLSEMTIPLGLPEIIRNGKDVTLVTYGASCKLAMVAAEDLASVGIETEIIDVRSLLPFDTHHLIRKSVQKTSRVLFLDEDVPGGATAYMMQQVLEVQGAYQFLDSEPRTLSAQEHRPAYGSDGNYWSKPNVETIFEAIYEMMHEANPKKHPLFFR
jgi:pyruvate/2-oxoglutarate/acetoin dehydrogenase E1 component/TPP-dependent pyruvate/acetoin dehydrogenase alpha subunit